MNYMSVHVSILQLCASKKMYSRNKNCSNFYVLKDYRSIQMFVYFVPGTSETGKIRPHQQARLSVANPLVVDFHRSRTARGSTYKRFDAET